MSLHSDILVVGAGPAGLSFAAELAGSGLKITLIEKIPLEILQNPPYDGREIALTHLSREIMQRLGMWDLIPKDEIYPLRDAKVLNGQSDYQLHFPQPTQARGEPADCLGYLISNHNIRKAAYEVVSKLENVTILTGTGVKEVKTSEDEAQVILENGEVLSGRLLLAADSRFSQTRRLQPHHVCLPHEAYPVQPAYRLRMLPLRPHHRPAALGRTSDQHSHYRR